MDREVMDQDVEQDWARDLFGRARDGGAEPAWTADPVAIGRAGDKRRRVRTLGARGGMLGAVAVTAAVALTLSSGPTSKDVGKVPGPASSGWNGRPLADVFTYAYLTGSGPKSGAQYYHDAVPQKAAQDEATILGLLDPTLSHLRAVTGSTSSQHVSQDTDPKAEDLAQLMLTSVWTSDGVAPKNAEAVPGKPSGQLSVLFTANSSALRGPGASPPDVSHDNIPCGYLIQMGSYVSPPDHPAHWSACVRQDLPDGSKIDTASTPNGTGTLTVAVREYPNDQGGVAIIAGNYPEIPFFKNGQPGELGAPPDPSTVLTPSPFSEAGLAAALADPAIKTGLTSDAKTAAPGGLLKAADLGAGWTFDAAASHGSTSEFPMDNGCAPDESIFGLAGGRMAQFSGKVPGGAAAQVFEGEYKLKAGTGPATMKLARTKGQGGCDPAPGVVFSKDFVTDLPAGIGDEAFVIHQSDTLRITIRFGDTILQADVNGPQNASGGASTLPDLSSPAGQAWVTSVAQQMAARWAKA